MRLRPDGRGTPGGGFSRAVAMMVLRKISEFLALDYAEAWHAVR